MQNQNDNHENQAFIQPIQPNQQPVLYHNVYSNQPVPIQALQQPQGQPQKLPDPYLAWSILNILFCGLLFGIIALVYSIKSEFGLRDRDYDKAATNSRMAKRFNIIGTVLGGVVVLMYFFYLALMIVLPHNSPNNE